MLICLFFFIFSYFLLCNFKRLIEKTLKTQEKQQHFPIFSVQVLVRHRKRNRKTGFFFPDPLYVQGHSSRWADHFFLKTVIILDAYLGM